MVIHRFDVFRVNLDPTIGSEIQKTRPCVVISPDEMNQNLRTVILAPMTTHGKQYPSRIPCKFRLKSGFVVLDQIRSVDKSRLVKRLGRLDRETARQVLKRLAEIFAP